jgi:NADPH-dependent ferric siderophore reductase
MSSSALERKGLTSIAYVAGEARTCKAVRRHLVQQNRPRKPVIVKPFWAPGKRGMD